MKAGRKPQSPAEHRARGTFRPDRHAHFADGFATEDMPVAPAWLTPSGREAWLDLIPRVTVTRRACELDSFALGTLANLIGAAALAWKAGAVPPAAHLSEMRRLQEAYGLNGAPSRVLTVPGAKDGPNPFLRNGKPPGAGDAP